MVAIRSEHLEALEAVIATALNILRTRPLADLYVRRDHTGEFRIKVQLEAGHRYVIAIINRPGASASLVRSEKHPIRRLPRGRLAAPQSLLRALKCRVQAFTVARII